MIGHVTLTVMVSLQLVWRLGDLTTWRDTRRVAPAMSAGTHAWRHIHYFWNARFHLWDKSHKIISCLTKLGRSKSFFSGNNTVISTLSTQRVAQHSINCLNKIGNTYKIKKIGNKTTRYRQLFYCSEGVSDTCPIGSRLVEILDNTVIL